MTNMKLRKQAIVEVDTAELSASLSSGALPLHVSHSVNEAKSFVYPDDDDNKQSKHKLQFLQDIDRFLRVVNKYAVMLNLVTIIWGSQHVVIKWVISDEHSNVDPATFSLIRFSIATFFSAPFTPLPSKCPVPGVPARLIWRWGFEMGIWMFLGFALQTVGLQFTSASRSAFLLYLNVKFVPFLGWFVLGKSIRRIALVSAMLALLGTFLLFSSNNLHNAANIGDLWSVMSAVISAMFILRMEAAMEHVTKENGAALSAASLWTVTVLNCCWAYLYSQDNIENIVWSVLVDIQGSIGYTWKVGNICALVPWWRVYFSHKLYPSNLPK